jgi:hypothetical protein
MLHYAYSALLLALSACFLSHCSPAPRTPETEVGSKRIERTMLDDIADRMQIREATERQRKADELVSRLEYYEAYKLYEAGGKPFENDRNLLYRKYQPLIDAQKTVAENDNSALAHYQLGRAFYDYASDPRGASQREASLELARRHLERSLKLDENQEHALLALAWVMEKQGRPEQFQPYIPKLEKIKDKSDMTLLFLGAENVRQGKYDLAMDYLTRIPDSSSHRIESLYYQGRIYAEKGLWLEALFNLSRSRNFNAESKKLFQEALDRVRPSSDNLRSQGMRAYGAAQYLEAAKYLQTHVLYHPEDLEAHYRLALSLLCSGQRNWAMEQFMEITQAASSLEGMNPIVIDSITRALDLQREMQSDPAPVRKAILVYFTRQVAMIDTKLEQALPSDKEIQAMAEDEVLFHSGWKKFYQRIQTLRTLEQSRLDTVNKANSLLQQNAIAHKEYGARIKSLEDRFQQALSKLKGRGGM